MKEREYILSPNKPQLILNHICLSDSFRYDLKGTEYIHYEKQYGGSSKN